MRVSRVLILLFAVFAGLYLVPRLLVIAPQERARHKEPMTKWMPQIEQALNRALSVRDGVCLHGDPYVLDKRAYKVSGPFADAADPDLYRPTCDRCEDLAEAGLLRKSVIQSQDRAGVVAISARFELTEFGRSFYREEIKPAHFKEDVVVSWKFCFGRSALHTIDEVLPPMTMGDSVAVGVKYTAQVLDAHPFLFDPKSRVLRLAVPANAGPALYPPRITTAWLRGDGSVDLDDGFRYGKFVNE